MVAVIFYFFYIGWVSGFVAMAAAVVAVVFLTTAFTGYCFLFRWLGLSTKMKKY
ncbi:MAG: YgaP-like transmembrane domain [Saprospiraceae bacterium]